MAHRASCDCKVGEDRAADAKPERGWRCAHRLDLSMFGIERFQRANPEKLAIAISQREKADGGIAKSVDRHHMARFRRRIRPHLRKMQRDQIANIGLVEFTLVETLIASHGKRWLGMMAMVCPC